MIQIIAINNHTNWLIPIGARGCNLNIRHNSVRIRVEVQVDSNFGIHPSCTMNCMGLGLCPSFLK